MKKERNFGKLIKMEKQTNLDFIKELLIRIGFMDVSNFLDLKHKDNTFYSQIESYNDKKQIVLCVTYKEGDFNKDLYLFFDMKEKIIKPI